MKSPGGGPGESPIAIHSAGVPFLMLDDETLWKQCEVHHHRSSGPGGQKRNKTSSAIRLVHRPTGLVVTAADDRSQRVNRIHALRRLREAIALHVRSGAASEDQKEGETGVNGLTPEGAFRFGRRDPAYFTAVQQVLDVLAACESSVSRAGRRLGLSTARMVKLLRSDPKLWRRANELRSAAGLKPLRDS